MDADFILRDSGAWEVSGAEVPAPGRTRRVGRSATPPRRGGQRHVVGPAAFLHLPFRKYGTSTMRHRWSGRPSVECMAKMTRHMRRALYGTSSIKSAGTAAQDITQESPPSSWSCPLSPQNTQESGQHRQAAAKPPVGPAACKTTRWAENDRQSSNAAVGTTHADPLRIGGPPPRDPPPRDPPAAPLPPPPSPTGRRLPGRGAARQPPVAR